MKRSHEEIIQINTDRNIQQECVYDPLTGDGAYGDRIEVVCSDFPIPRQMIPAEMTKIKMVNLIRRRHSIKSILKKDDPEGLAEVLIQEFTILRARYDFEFWAIMFSKIKNKAGGDDIPFRMNRPQRKLFARMEGMRRRRVPIRIILLKARQWGGSTLVQLYMAWIQFTQKTGWNSVIAAHVKDSARNVKGMYAKIVHQYPPFLLRQEESVELRPFQGSVNTSWIEELGSKITIGSAEAPDSLRGEDTSMAHCTEVAFWRKTENKTPEELVRSVCGGIAYLPNTLIAYESTANGTGNFFHKEWMRAKDGKSDKEPVFVAWYEIESYRITIEDYPSFVNGMNEYDLWLFEKGATLESIAWYKEKLKEYSDHADMMAEYPSDDVEAFKHSGQRVFSIYKVNDLRKKCIAPIAIGELAASETKGSGAIRELRFQQDDHGCLKIFDYPYKERKISNQYVVIVDVGGRSKKADFSVITVIDRSGRMNGGKDRVVAQWRGHIDHDLLAWKAIQIAAYYNNALLVIESNTYETENNDGDQTEYILEEISGVYDNLYARTDADKIREGAPIRYGFHTNSKTKPMIITNMVELVREGGYEESDADACDEMDVFEKKQNGSFGAQDGYHDDILMTRMIGLYVSKNMDDPVVIVAKSATRSKRQYNEADF